MARGSYTKPLRVSRFGYRERCMMRADRTPWRGRGIRTLTLTGLLATVAAVATLLTPLAAPAPDAPNTLTFTKDVAPIFQKSCQTCHHPGTAAPMSLLTYDEVRPWARSIRQRVASRDMPPWHLDKTVGIRHYKNDRSLSDEEIATIARWADNGA